ncbi:HAD-IA family hydrolase [Streptomyces sp. NPDC088258]|uniref:HAD-IA family hydrolase n=1 Tax=Streptomyces sp. NPDC088258 TaxID=3365849 RepID=UPI00382EE38D
MLLTTEAILFDLDGVLVDSSRCVARAWFRWAERNGLDAERTFALGHGRTTLDHIRAAAPHLATEEAAAEIDALEERHIAEVRAEPGAVAATEELTRAEVAWGVVTACTLPVATARLSLAGIIPPSVMVTADELRRGKPAPDGYLLGCSRVGVDPARTLVFEDAPAGIEAARAAGTQVVALCTTHRAEQLLEADAAVRDLSQVRFQQTPGRNGVTVGITSFDPKIA